MGIRNKGGKGKFLSPDIGVIKNQLNIAAKNQLVINTVVLSFISLKALLLKMQRSSRKRSFCKIV